MSTPQEGGFVQKQVRLPRGDVSFRIEPDIWEEIREICRKSRYKIKDLIAAIDERRVGKQSLANAIRMFVRGNLRAMIQDAKTVIESRDKALEYAKDRIRSLQKELGDHGYVYQAMDCKFHTARAMLDMMERNGVTIDMGPDGWALVNKPAADLQARLNKCRSRLLEIADMAKVSFQESL